MRQRHFCVLMRETEPVFAYMDGASVRIVEPETLPLAEETESVSTSTIGDQRNSGARLPAEAKGGVVVLAIPSDQCLAAGAPSEAFKHANNYQSLTYAAEEFLPLAAEELVVNRSSAHGCEFIVATAADDLKKFLDSLESSDLIIQNICPEASLALQWVIHQGVVKKTHRLVVWYYDGQAEVWALDNLQPFSWFYFADGRDVGTALAHIYCDDDFASDQVCWIGDPLTTVDASPFAKLTEVNSCEASFQDAVVNGGRLVANDSVPPLFDFRVGPFASRDKLRRLAPWVLASLLVTTIGIAVVGGALFRRAEAYRRLHEDNVARQLVLYRERFPEGRVPVAINSRLESELRKTRGQRGEDESLPDLVSAMGVLKDTLDALPVGQRYRILEIRVESNSVYIDGELRNHGDADILASGLRQHSFDVERPRTGKIDDKHVSVSISASRNPTNPEVPK